jgi:hypothetical protein
MIPVRGVTGWLPLVLLNACVASHPRERRARTQRPAVDRLLSRGDIQVTHFKFLTCRSTSPSSHSPANPSACPLHAGPRHFPATEKASPLSLKRSTLAQWREDEGDNLFG